MTYCPVCQSTDSANPITLFSDTWYRLESCGGCGRILSARVLDGADNHPLPSADEMVAVAEAIVRRKV